MKNRLLLHAGYSGETIPICLSLIIYGAPKGISSQCIPSHNVVSWVKTYIETATITVIPIKTALRTWQLKYKATSPYSSRSICTESLRLTLNTNQEAFCSLCLWNVSQATNTGVSALQNRNQSTIDCLPLQRCPEEISHASREIFKHYGLPHSLSPIHEKKNCWGTISIKGQTRFFY